MTARPSASSSAARRFLVLSAKITVSVGLLWLLLRRVELGQLWTYARSASLPWLAAALALYLLMILISAWRWKLLLDVQAVGVTGGRLVNSYLVATFFNNFLPSNIGGDVIRIRDTAAEAGSKTTATTVVLVDRGIGLLGLVLVAAMAATVGVVGGTGIAALAPMLWVGFAAGSALAASLLMAPGGVARVLGPLRRIHQEWVTERITRMTRTLARFGQSPRALAACLGGAVLVQLVLVAFYAAIARSMGIPVPAWHLAVIIPVSFIVQMAPVSLNGFGVREAVFTYYFARLAAPPTRLPLPAESALALSFMGAVLVMCFSLSGAAAYWWRASSAAAWRPSPADAFDE